jgi:hypothetical protein
MNHKWIKKARIILTENPPVLKSVKMEKCHSDSTENGSVQLLVRCYLMQTFQVPYET